MGQVNCRVRREVFFTGTVQGVGFRYTVRRMVETRFVDLAGYVENLADGRVHLVVEGPTERIDELIAEIGKTMEGYIESVELSGRETSGGFTGFSIRHGRDSPRG